MTVRLLNVVSVLVLVFAALTIAVAVVDLLAQPSELPLPGRCYLMQPRHVPFIPDWAAGSYLKEITCP